MSYQLLTRFSLLWVLFPQAELPLPVPGRGEEEEGKVFLEVRLQRDPPPLLSVPDDSCDPLAMWGAKWKGKKGFKEPRSTLAFATEAVYP